MSNVCPTPKELAERVAVLVLVLVSGLADALDAAKRQSLLRNFFLNPKRKRGILLWSPQ